MQLVASSLPLGSYVTPTRLQQILDQMGIDGDHARLRKAVPETLEKWAGEADALAWSPGGWRIRVTGPAVQTAVAASLLWATLSALDVGPGIPLAVIPALVPMLFQIDRITLTRREEEIVASLVVQNHVQVGTSRELYDALPDTMRKEVGYLDFVDLIEKLVEAGRAERAGEQRYVVDVGGQSCFRVTFS